uniref:Uncharacterized protein n=1 Tax=Apteryx owenii TaxID=8824 RepID=A0A8B9NWL9_APTOW
GAKPDPSALEREAGKLEATKCDFFPKTFASRYFHTCARLASPAGPAWSHPIPAPRQVGTEHWTCFTYRQEKQAGTPRRSRGKPSHLL